MFYLENLFSLISILKAAGYEVHIASLIEGLEEPIKINLPSGNQLELKPISRQGNYIGVENFFPCVVLLNNDLSSGCPEILEGIEQTLLSPLELGWTNRYKTEHFAHYSEVTKVFSDLIGIDEWLITPTSILCGPVNYKEQIGLEKLSEVVTDILEETQECYNKHCISSKPFVVVKSDSGTYGMAIMSVDSSEDIFSLTSKQRNKMSYVKEGLQVEQMLVQEGVYTYESIEDAVAEPVVYLIGNQVVGGFYRIHTDKTVKDNLNSPGMHFEPFIPDASTNRFYAYSVIARLALLAAAREMAEARGTLPSLVDI